MEPTGTANTAGTVHRYREKGKKTAKNEKAGGSPAFSAGVTDEAW